MKKTEKEKELLNKFDYEKMLDRLYLSLPEQALKRERFEMPTAESMIQGNKTIIKNLGAILKLIHRDEKHLLKFISKETATSSTISEGRLILIGKFSEKQVNDMIQNYTKQYVLCHECLRPDTKFIERQGVKAMKCEACGAITPIKPL